MAKLLTTTQPTVSLEALRAALHDELRAFRTSAQFVAERPGHSDAAARAALKPFGEFPSRDGLLKSYVTGLAAAIHGYAAALAARGFSREQQSSLASRIEAFLDGLQTRGAQQGEAKAARKSAEAVLDELRVQVSYFRRGGHGALYGQRASADFDRLPPKAKRKKKKAPAKGGAASGAGKESAAPAGG